MACWKREAEAKVKAEAKAESLNLSLNLNLNRWLTLIEVGLGLAVASLALRLAPRAILRLAQDAARPAAQPATPACAEAARLWRLADAVARRLPRRPTCLAQALAVGWLLRRRGIATTLRFGVRRAAGVFAAHAWLECAGRTVGPAHVTQDFSSLARVDSPA